jgi:uncharacterized membrane protein
MDQTHLHLVITHLPIVGSFLGALVLTYGLRTSSIHTQTAAYFLLVISSIGAIISYLTGEAAEETVENIAGISESLVERHEEFALIALVALIVLGLASLVGLILSVRKSSAIRTVAWITLIIAIVSFGLLAWTGYLGGQIRHSEVHSAYHHTKKHDPNTRLEAIMLKKH